LIGVTGAAAGYIQHESVNHYIDSYPTLSENQTNMFKVTFWIAVIATVVLICLGCVLRKNVNKAISIIKAASRCIKAMQRIVFFPLVPLLQTLGLVAYFVIVAGYIMSMEKGLNKISMGTSAVGVNTTAGFTLSEAQSKNLREGLFAYHFFGFLWTNALIQAIGMFTIAGAVCHWYWDNTKSGGNGNFYKSSPIWTSFKWAHCHHLGSLAFGALLVAIIQFIRAIFEYVQNKMPKEARNTFVKAAVCCIRCCLACIEKCIQYVTRNSYIIIAMKGNSFCRACLEAFHLIMDHAVGLATISTVTCFIMTLGKLTVSTLGALFCYTWISGTVTVTNLYVPTLLAAFLAYQAAALVFSSFEMAIDTITVCVFADEAGHWDEGTKGHFYPEGIHDTLPKQDETDV